MTDIRTSRRGPRVDLNGDVGESFGVYTIGHDERLIPSLSSANVACGFHAGDPTVARRTVRLALDHGVAVGAHPGFPDRLGFGRRRLEATATEVEDMTLYQVAALAGITSAEGGQLAHVKPHGALYAMAASDPALAAAVARGVAAVDPTLILYGPSGSCLLDAGREAGLAVASEVFADRAYDATGRLVGRRRPGAVIHDPRVVVDRAVRLVVHGYVPTDEGAMLSLRADTLCVHGDTPGAAELAAGVRAALVAAGVAVVAPDGS